MTMVWPSLGLVKWPPALFLVPPTRCLGVTLHPPPSRLQIHLTCRLSRCRPSLPSFAVPLVELTSAKAPLPLVPTVPSIQNLRPASLPSLSAVSLTPKKSVMGDVVIPPLVMIPGGTPCSPLPLLSSVAPPDVRLPPPLLRCSTWLRQGAKLIVRGPEVCANLWWPNPHVKFVAIESTFLLTWLFDMLLKCRPISR